MEVIITHSVSFGAKAYLVEEEPNGSLDEAIH